MLLNSRFTFPEFLQDYIFKVMFELGWDPLMRNYGLKIIFYYIHGQYLPKGLWRSYNRADVYEGEGEGSNEFKNYMDQPYPWNEDLYLMRKKKVYKVKTRYAQRFSMLRKLMADEWKLMDYKDQVNILGTREAPLSIDMFDVDFEDVDTIIRLTTVGEHAKVGNLTKEQAERLDRTSKILGLDKEKVKYLERSRLGCEDLLVIKAVLNGRTVLKDNEIYEKAYIVEGWKQEIKKT
jgi:hypothetical protein